MPVIGEPTPYHQTLLAHRTNDTVAKAVDHLAGLFPKPHNYPTAFGFALRKQRLGVELSEFDLLHRQRRGRSASFANLCDVGKAIIGSKADRFPTDRLPVDQRLLVNHKTYNWLISVIDAGEAERNKERCLKRRARTASKRGTKS